MERCRKPGVEANLAYIITVILGKKHCFQAAAIAPW